LVEIYSVIGIALSDIDSESQMGKIELCH